MSYIIEGVYIGSESDALKPEKLKEHGITHVLTIDGKPLPIELHKGFEYKYVHALDMEDTDILSHLQDYLDFIECGRNAGGVLVHCYAGQSRSATLVIAHVMVRLDMGFEDAMKLVKCQKSDISPNPGFQEQLSLFETMKNKLDNTHQGYKMFKLQNLSRNMQSALGQEGMLSGKLSADPSTQPCTASVLFKCKKCRRPLFQKDALLIHEEGHGEAAFKYTYKSTEHSLKNQNATSKPDCSRSLFIEPVQWMKSDILDITGKVSCPKCSAKLGSYTWAGERCPCGQWVTPAFHIQTGKVDEAHPRIVPALRPAFTASQPPVSNVAQAHTSSSTAAGTCE